MKNLPISLILISIFFSSCNETQNHEQKKNLQVSSAFDLNEAKQIIQEKTKLFTSAHITKDTAFLNNIVTLDARSFPPNSEPVIGRKAIAELNYEWVNYGIHEFTEESIAFYGNEDYLIDEGNYFLSFGEEKITDKGSYINIWKKEDGEWKIYSNIWNTNLPQ